MDFVGSPIVTMVLNIIAAGLVSHGILDSQAKDQFVQLLNNLIAAVITAAVAFYSIFKVVDLHKHKITSAATMKTMTASAPAETPVGAPAPQISQEISQPAPTNMSGLPNSTQPVNNQAPVA